MTTAVQPPLALIWPNWLGRPATTEAKINKDMAHVEGGHQVEAGGVAAPEPGATVVEQVGETGGLQDGDADGDVAGPLGDLPLADRPLVLPLLELRDHHAEDLHDDRRRDVRHDPEGQDGEVGERP